jgi:hypothetical protein
VQFHIRKVFMERHESQAWEELYAAAVLETDSNKVADRIDKAQDALRDRWHTLQQMPVKPDRERQRIEDAIRTLNMICATEGRALPGCFSRLVE